MKGTRYILALIICVFFICSCASPLKKRLVTGEIPKYTGPITPITIPVQLEYKPAKYRTDSSSFVSANGTADQGSANEKHESLEKESSMSVITHIAKLGDMLTYTATTKEMTENYQTFKSDIPFVEIKLLIDKYGNIKESEMSLPFFEQKYVKSNMKEDELEKIRQEMKNIVKYIKSLPQEPVVTGSTLHEFRVFEFLSKEIFHVSLTELIKEEPKHIVKGWGYFEGKKVLISFTDYLFEKSDPSSSGDKIQILINGYSLWDADTFMPVRAELFMNIDVSFRSSHVIVKGITISSSKIIN